MHVGCRIKGSVGKGGLNHHDDVALIQTLINDHLPTVLRWIRVNGECGSLTIFAIEEIQRYWMGMRHPDGKVDPGGATFLFLTKGHGRPQNRPTPAEVFPQNVIAAAQAAQKAWGVPASITLAQWRLESDWGKHMPLGSNNPFGIKAKKADKFVEAYTHEFDKKQNKMILVKAKFRKFDSLAEAFDYHGKLLATLKAYRPAMAVANDPNAFADKLTGVYATDPAYGGKLKKVIAAYHLDQYDQSDRKGAPAVRLP